MRKNKTITPERELLTRAKRIVVKVGTHILVDERGFPHRRRINMLVKQLCQLQETGKQVVLVSSGAVGAGLKALGFKKRPTSICNLQMAAAVGQTRLLHCYQRYFRKAHKEISQILLTHADLKNRTRHLNARNTILNLLRSRVIPIVNENDVVSVDEIRVGDNDVLSALVASMVDADLLILLTTPEGLLKPSEGNKMERVPYLEKITPSILALATPSKNALATGGMASKLKAAQMASRQGALVVIASGHAKNILADITRGTDVGTLISHELAKKLVTKRKRWIHYFHRPEGQITIDAGAVLALQEKGKSLLPAGITAVSGTFSSGSQVCIINTQGSIIGYGLVEYNHSDIDKIKGCKSKDIAEILGMKGHHEVIHRNNMVIEENT